MPGKSTETLEPAGRILRSQMEQGWSVATLELLSRRFIEKSGLSGAYADFLENQAIEENREHDDFEDREDIDSPDETPDP